MGKGNRLFSFKEPITKQISEFIFENAPLSCPINIEYNCLGNDNKVMYKYNYNWIMKCLNKRMAERESDAITGKVRTEKERKNISTFAFIFVHMKNEYCNTLFEDLFDKAYMNVQKMSSWVTVKKNPHYHRSDTLLQKWMITHICTYTSYIQWTITLYFQHEQTMPFPLHPETHLAEIPHWWHFSINGQVYI